VSDSEPTPDAPDEPDSGASPLADAAETNGDAKKKKKPDFGSGRAVETLFKILYRNHIELTAIADTKANIMVGINGLLTSVSLGVVVPRLESGAIGAAFPALILIVGCAVSLVCAILSARPRVSSAPVTLADVRAGRANVLFFGHFQSLGPGDFIEGLHDLMEQPKMLFDQMGRDVYVLGSVLTAKYRLLRASYTALLVTVVATAASALAIGVLG
jgi:hypothetical protein